jgi:predicted O-methyltransferase YrrM
MRLFRKKLKQEHKVMLEAERAQGALLPEYHRPTAECPHPERWHMYDSMTAEVEVLEFLRTLVTTVKPSLVVETGSFLGVSTLWIAEGLRANGFGKIISCEYDPVVFAKAKEKIEASPLAPFIELRNESSLEMKIDGTIDIFFSDSDMPIREAEIKRYLPQIRPTGVILTHDASSHLKIVREAAFRLEAEGLISAVFLPTPRGLVIAQPRKGRA